MIHPGFADPVLDSQACFRAVLDAMARPGTIHHVRAPSDPPPPLGRAAAATVLTLVDQDTPVWLDSAAEGARDWIGFHCGAPPAALEQAAFALALRPVPMQRLHAGSDDAPESGATLILQLAALGAGQRFRLSGPGLKATSEFMAEGLPPGFAADWAANCALFPRGIDLVLCAGDRVAAFPRTLQIGEA